MIANGPYDKTTHGQYIHSNILRTWKSKTNTPNHIPVQANIITIRFSVCLLK